jgi:hypothetical protein
MNTCRCLMAKKQIPRINQEKRMAGTGGDLA